ncbi:hypothetical protein PN466_02030 [Roseofilum reptotaenium CS-1145]|nr:hypothetical protein [Roseofilum reptotaenium]MDB9515737.1 hypothetical protein [Roseofilum reptotaenium CS-1145]
MMKRSILLSASLAVLATIASPPDYSVFNVGSASGDHLQIIPQGNGEDKTVPTNVKRDSV